MKIAKISAALSLFGTLLASEAANAATYINPGTLCRTKNLQEDANFIWRWHGQLENQSNATDSLAVYCPLTRHNATSNLTGLWARVWNDVAFLPVNMILQSFPANAQSGDFEIEDATAQGYSSISFNTANLTLYTYGKYVLQVNLFDNDRLDSVRYDEP